MGKLDQRVRQASDDLLTQVEQLLVVYNFLQRTHPTHIEGLGTTWCQASLHHDEHLREDDDDE